MSRWASPVQDHRRTRASWAHAGEQTGWELLAGRWPDAFESLRRELSSDRGRPAFVDSSDTAASELIDRLVSLVDGVVSLGARVADFDEPPTVADLLAGINGSSTVLVDIDVLFAAALHLEVVSQLRRTAQSTALIVVWPGRIAGGRLSYSLPGRADHLDEPARDLVVLRPLVTEFPDEIPYTVERYPA